MCGRIRSLTPTNTTTNQHALVLLQCIHHNDQFNVNDDHAWKSEGGRTEERRQKRLHTCNANALTHSVHFWWLHVRVYINSRYANVHLFLARNLLFSAAIVVARLPCLVGILTNG